MSAMYMSGPIQQNGDDTAAITVLAFENDRFALQADSTHQNINLSLDRNAMSGLSQAIAAALFATAPGVGEEPAP